MFGHLLAGRFPTLWRHLSALEVDAASVTMHWFLCCFLNSLPLDSTLRGELQWRVWRRLHACWGYRACWDPTEANLPSLETKYCTAPADPLACSMGLAVLRGKPRGAVSHGAGTGGDL